MVFKFLNLHQLIPTCFYLLTPNTNNDHVSFIQPLNHPHHHPQTNPNHPIPTKRKKRPIRVITSNGIVLLYTKPIRAMKVMHEFPTHLLCRSDSFYIGQKIPPLNPKTKLKPNHNYFLLPKPYFQSTLTFASAAASFAAAASSKPRGLCSTKLVNSCKAFSIEKGVNGGLKIRVSDEFIAQLCTEQITTSFCDVEKEKKRVCNTPELEKDYVRLVGERSVWRPKLETINEKEKRRFRGLRRKKGVQGLKGLVVSQLRRLPRLKKDNVGKFRV